MHRSLKSEVGMTTAPSHRAGQKECSQWTLVGQLAQRLAGDRGFLKACYLSHPCPYYWIRSSPLQSFMSQGRPLSSVKEIDYSFTLFKKEYVISQDCDSSSVSAQPPNSCGSVPGGRCDGTVLFYMPLRGGKVEIWRDESWGTITCSFWSPFWVLSFTTSADFLWGYTMNGMGLSWRVSSKVITSNWFWKPANWFLLLERSSVDIGNRFHCGWVMPMWP